MSIRQFTLSLALATCAALNTTAAPSALPTPAPSFSPSSLPTLAPTDSDNGGAWLGLSTDDFDPALSASAFIGYFALLAIALVALVPARGEFAMLHPWLARVKASETKPASTTLAFLLSHVPQASCVPS